LNTPAKSVINSPESPLVVWRLLDGKTGHEAQSEGLVTALGQIRVVECHDVAVPGRFEALWDWVLGRCRLGMDLPDPHLLVCAGHRTHFALLTARRARGGRSIVLMRPSLPQCWFDLCLIPAHDGPRERDNIIVTEGVLNTIGRAEAASLEKGLVLVGGPSAHHNWDAEAMLEQIRTVAQDSVEVQWVLTTSRRTPPETVAALLALAEPNLEVVPAEATPPGWVGEQLQACGLVWVSEDSVSMVYEALTAGVRVGLLEVPTKGKRSRVVGGVASLVDSGRVVSYSNPLPDLAGCKPSDKFNEAKRCATAILQKFNSLS
jgi:mitochondrial fission protein ELM1